MSEAGVEERLRSIMGEILECDLSERDAGTPREQILEWDSLKHLQMVMAVEEAFGVRFAMERIPELDSIAAVRDAVSEQL
ncbi:MAG: acyl carrier protein [Gemmatimonadota bacterium]|jgi:acyl carrier protein